MQRLPPSGLTLRPDAHGAPLQGHGHYGNHANAHTICVDSLVMTPVAFLGREALGSNFINNELVIGEHLRQAQCRRGLSLGRGHRVLINAHRLDYATLNSPREGLVIRESLFDSCYLLCPCVTVYVESWGGLA
jgi:hypothetical protein